MRTVVFGQIVEKIYSVDGKVKDGVFRGKPELKMESKIKKWKEICSYKGAPRYNYPDVLYGRRFNISEDEEVLIKKEVFRADLNEAHLFIDKVLEEIELNKTEAEVLCDEMTELFNKRMIESNRKLKDYCDLHKLTYEDTDCIKLFKLVYPDDEYEIVNGVMKAKDKYCISSLNDCYIGGKVTTICDDVTAIVSATSCRADSICSISG